MHERKPSVEQNVSGLDIFGDTLVAITIPADGVVFRSLINHSGVTPPYWSGDVVSAITYGERVMDTTDVFVSRV